MSLRASPIKPGRSYMIRCNGNETVVIAKTGCDAIIQFLTNKDLL